MTTLYAGCYNNNIIFICKTKEMVAKQLAKKYAYIDNHYPTDDINQNIKYSEIAFAKNLLEAKNNIMGMFEIYQYKVTLKKKP